MPEPNILIPNIEKNQSFPLRKIVIIISSLCISTILIITVIFSWLTLKKQSEAELSTSKPLSLEQKTLLPTVQPTPKTTGSAIAFLQSGAKYNYDVVIYDIQNLKEQTRLKSTYTNEHEWIWRLSPWSRNGKYLPIIDDHQSEVDDKKKLQFYDSDMKQFTPEYPLEHPNMTTNYVSGRGWMSDNEFVLVAGPSKAKDCEQLYNFTPQSFYQTPFSATEACVVVSTIDIQGNINVSAKRLSWLYKDANSEIEVKPKEFFDVRGDIPELIVHRDGKIFPVVLDVHNPIRQWIGTNSMLVTPLGFLGNQLVLTAFGVGRTVKIIWLSPTNLSTQSATEAVNNLVSPNGTRVYLLDPSDPNGVIDVISKTDNTELLNNVVITAKLGPSNNVFIELGNSETKNVGIYMVDLQSYSVQKVLDITTLFTDGSTAKDFWPINNGLLISGTKGELILNGADKKNITICADACSDVQVPELETLQEVYEFGTSSL